MGPHEAVALTWELVTDVKDHKLFIAKLEHNSLFPSPIEKEKEAYEDLGSSHGIAGMVGLLNQDDYRVLILEFLGPDLHDLVDFCGGSFSLKTTLMLADQMICRLEYLHSKNILHRDLKPDNFLMGRGRSGNIVYITDFGLASSYNWTEKHISVRDRSNFIGSERFASIRGHKLLCEALVSFLLAMTEYLTTPKARPERMIWRAWGTPYSLFFVAVFPGTTSCAAMMSSNARAV